MENLTKTTPSKNNRVTHLIQTDSKTKKKRFKFFDLHF